MVNYALIKDGVVENVVVWNGEGNIFEDFTTYEIHAGITVGPGYSAAQDSSGNWTFTAPVIVITAEEQDRINLVTAQSEYVRASDKITALQQQIDDEDYSGTDTAATISATKTIWTTYRKALRAYLAAADGNVSLPANPDA